MKMSYYQNQLHKPRRRQYDETQKVRLYFKCGGNTMLMCKGLTALAATSLEMNIVHYMKRHDVKLEGHFIQTRL